jgi:hypothetical protein
VKTSTHRGTKQVQPIRLRPENCSGLRPLTVRSPIFQRRLCPSTRVAPLAFSSFDCPRFLVGRHCGLEARVAALEP